MGCEAEQGWWCFWGCSGNAAVESFFGLAQKSVLNRRIWASRNGIRLALVT